MNNKEPPIWW